MEPDEVLSVAVAIVDDSSDPAFLVSMDGKILAWNRAACEFFGIPVWQASAQNCAAVVGGHAEDGEALCVRDCSIREQLRQGVSAKEMDMVALTGARPSTTRRARVHHLPVTHPDAGPLGILHLLSRTDS
jgi:PAS domain-containing protein